jgi:hypothetical protein
VIELLFEALLQLFLEIFGDFIVHMIPTDRRSWSAILAFVGYAAAGALLGYGSVVVFPAHFIADREMRILNLIVTPIAIGALMMWIGTSAGAARNASSAWSVSSMRTSSLLESR